MVILEDYILHLYVKKSSSLDSEVKNQIENQLRFDGTLQRRISEIEDFYESYEEISNSKSEPESGSIVSKNIIPLTLFSTFENINTTKLAAATGLVQTNEFRHIKSFASAEHLIIAKVFYNSLSKKYSIYLIAENVNDVSNAIVRIKGVGFFAADTNGFVNINVFNFSDNVDLTIFRPIINYPLITGSNDSPPDNGIIIETVKTNGGIVFKLKKYAGRFSVKLTGIQKDKEYKGFIISDDNSSIIKSFSIQSNKVIESDLPDFISKLIIIESE